MSTLIRRILDRAIQGPQPPALIPIPQAKHRGGRHPEDWPAPGTSTGGVLPRELTTPVLQHSMEAAARQETLR